MSENLTLYNAVRVVPAEAQKEIKGGRLSGMTDINPMWRIKTLTEHFGVCGIGWKYKQKDRGIIEVTGDQKMAFVDIELQVKVDGEWSEPIFGTGGSMLVVNEKNGPHVNDECFKMALTDAISVACKALGFGADIYWQKDKTKYNGVTAGDAEKVFNPSITPEDEEYINNQQAPTDTGDKTDIVKLECEICQTSMTQAQQEVSKHKFDGRTLCPKHQAIEKQIMKEAKEAR